MFGLPRGIGTTDDVALSTAAWERPEAIERLVYRGDGSIFLGAIPAGDQWGRLKQFRDNAAALRNRIDEQPWPPAKRAAAIDALDALWLTAQRSDVVPVGFKDDRHLVTVAGARSGKGRSSIVPNLCIYPGSVLVIDPKGENASLTAEQRHSGTSDRPDSGQDVYVLDPFGVASVPDALRASLNPLALLDLAADTIIDDVALLADALVIPTGSDGAHWDESARSYLRGLTLYLVATRPGANLFTLRHFLTQGDREGYEVAKANDPELEARTPSALWFLLDNMKAVSTGNTQVDDVIIGAAVTLGECGENERGSILSTARRNTAFLDTIGDNFRKTLGGEGRAFDPDLLKTAKAGASVYLCLPASRMSMHSRWLRVVINLTLERLQRSLTPPAAKAPILFVLDEFYTLGPMPMIENAAGFAAGFGIKLWPILQDLQQLKTLYPTSWQTFLANAGAVQVFGASDAETCGYVSQMLGEVETRQHVASMSITSQSGFGQRSEADRVSPLVGALGAKQYRAAVFQAASLAAADDRSQSGGTSGTTNRNEQITLAPLLRPDEVALHFAREAGACLVMIKGRRPVWCLRVDYDTSPWFTGRYTALGHLQGREPPAAAPFGSRAPQAFAQCVAALTALSRSFDTG